MLHRLEAYSLSCLERLSEKGFGQRSDRGHGRYTEHEEGLWMVCRAPLQAPLTLFGQSLEGKFSETHMQLPAQVHLEDAAVPALLGFSAEGPTAIM